MVEFVDGSIIAEMSTPDMGLPIHCALTYPARAGSDRVQTSRPRCGSLRFEEPDVEKFPSVELARWAGTDGGFLPAMLNAENEVAVDAFFDRKIGFTQITETVARTMLTLDNVPHPSFEQIVESDRWAREQAAGLL